MAGLAKIVLGAALGAAVAAGAAVVVLLQYGRLAGRLRAAALSLEGEWYG